MNYADRMLYEKQYGQWAQPYHGQVEDTPVLDQRREKTFNETKQILANIFLTAFVFNSSIDKELYAELSTGLQTAMNMGDLKILSAMYKGVDLMSTQEMVGLIEASAPYFIEQ